VSARREVSPDSVVARVSMVLDAFAADVVELGLNELARSTGLPKTSTHRLAGALVDEGLLERSGTRYRLGARLLELGQRVPRRRLLREAALPFLEDLFIATRETVHFAVVDGTQVTYLQRIAGHRPAAVPSRVAGRMPMHCTATGKALLAFSPPELMAGVVATGLGRRTTSTITSAARLSGELSRIRADGVAFECEEMRLGVASVAAPVFGRGGVVMGAVGVTGSSARIDPGALAPTVRAVARALSRTLRSLLLDGS